VTERIIQNRLLATFTAAGAAALGRNLKQIRVSRGEPLPRSTAAATFSYFPIDSVLATIVVAEDGRTASTGIIGSEGGIYLPGVEGAAPSTPMTLAGGSLYRVESSVLSRSLADHVDAQTLLGRYADYRLAEGLVLTACAGHHVLEQRLCLRLLRLCDRLGGTCRTTHELLALTLGVRRATVTTAIRRLESRGFVETERGLLRVRSRAGLRKTACVCYRLLTDALNDMWEGTVIEHGELFATSEDV